MDPYGAAKKIEKYARKWEQYANIRFVFNYAYADIRIGFDWDDNKSVTWSYTGTDSKLVTDLRKPTLNFADWNYLSEEEQEGDVLRAFGQVLGLELEHRHLDFDPGWKSEDRIASLWEGQISDIPWSQLQDYVFTPLEKANVEETADYDAESIMIWPFPRGYAQNTARDYNNQLSDQDMEFIGELYPRENLENIIEFDFIYLEGRRRPQGLEIEISDPRQTTIPLIDYGDGTIRSDGGYVYSKTGTYYVRVYANPQTINGIELNPEPADDGIITQLSFNSLFDNLQNLSVGNITDSKLGLDQMPNIVQFNNENVYQESPLIAPNIDQFGWDYIKKISEAPVVFYLDDLDKLQSISLGNVLNPEFKNLESCSNLRSIIVGNYQHYTSIPGYLISETRSVETSSSDEGLLNIVNNLPSNSGKIKIKNNNNSDLAKSRISLILKDGLWRTNAIKVFIKKTKRD